MNSAKITDFLNPDQIEAAFAIYQTLGGDSLLAAKMIQEQVIEPNMDQINQRLGQTNDPAYIGYAVLFVLRESQKEHA